MPVRWTFVFKNFQKGRQLYIVLSKKSNSFSLCTIYLFILCCRWYHSRGIHNSSNIYLTKESIILKIWKFWVSTCTHTPNKICKDQLPRNQGWPWARVKWATVLGLTLKLSLISKFFKALMPHLKIRSHPKIFKVLIERPQYIYIYKN